MVRNEPARRHGHWAAISGKTQSLVTGRAKTHQLMQLPVYDALAGTVDFVQLSADAAAGCKVEAGTVVGGGVLMKHAHGEWLWQNDECPMCIDFKFPELPKALSLAASLALLLTHPRPPQPPRRQQRRPPRRPPRQPRAAPSPVPPLGEGTALLVEVAHHDLVRRRLCRRADGLELAIRLILRANRSRCGGWWGEGCGGRLAGKTGQAGAPESP